MSLQAVRSRLYAYGFAIGSVAVALALMLALNPIADMSRTPFLLFFGAVVLASWRMGVRSGLLATILSALISNYFFLPPYHTLSLETTASVRLLLFSLESVVISVLCGSLRDAHRKLDRSVLQLRRNQDSLNQANRRITEILGSITDGFYVLDHQWRFIYVNSQTETQMRQTRDHLLNRSIWEVLPDWEGTPMADCYLKAVKTQKPMVVETTGLINPDRWYELHVTPIQEGLAVYFRDLTSRKQEEHLLYQHMQMLNFANDSIIIRSLEDDCIRYWNHGAVRQYGFSEDWAMGQIAHQLLKTVFPEPIEVIHEILLEQNYWQGELMQTTAAGQTIIVNSRWTLQRTAMGTPQNILEINHDITQRKQDQAALQRSELHFRTLANSMPQMFWTTRIDGAVDYFNQRWYDYTGLSVEESLGWKWQDALHPEDGPLCIRTWRDAVKTGSDYQVEYRFKRGSDGQYRWHLGLAFPLRDEAGQIIKWFGSCTDIHDQKMALAERNLALNRERAAREEAEAANRTKDEFLAVLSHELRSPLNPILGWVSLLRSRQLTSKMYQQALETIERNAKLQAQLIEDLLDVSRILRGKLPLDVESVDLAKTIKAALETVQLSLNAKAIQLHTELDSVDSVAGDAKRIQQIVWNLLSNAVKFTPEQGHITLRLSQTNGHAYIQVQDTGQGIDPEFLPFVFERFRQADSTTTREFGGLGLGLSIVRYLSELHGGYVQVDSAGPNQGSTFTVCLPTQGRCDIPRAAAVPDPSGGVELTGLSFLIIDDDPDLRNLLQFTLESQGNTILTADSAQAGFEILAHHCPDALICDIGMPGIDGYMFIQQLRQRPPEAGGEIPAIALTAYAGESNRKAALEAGFQEHLSKPVLLDELNRTIAQLVSP